MIGSFSWAKTRELGIERLYGVTTFRNSDR
jgi:hypothetical protein